MYRTPVAPPTGICPLRLPAFVPSPLPVGGLDAISVRGRANRVVCRMNQDEPAQPSPRCARPSQGTVKIPCFYAGDAIKWLHLLSCSAMWFSGRHCHVRQFVEPKADLIHGLASRASRNKVGPVATLNRELQLRKKNSRSDLQMRRNDLTSFRDGMVAANRMRLRQLVIRIVSVAAIVLTSSAPLHAD